jgi:hypothetical protein
MSDAEKGRVYWSKDGRKKNNEELLCTRGVVGLEALENALLTASHIPPGVRAEEHESLIKSQKLVQDLCEKGGAISKSGIPLLIGGNQLDGLMDFIIRDIRNIRLSQVRKKLNNPNLAEDLSPRTSVLLVKPGICERMGYHLSSNGGVNFLLEYKDTAGVPTLGGVRELDFLMDTFATTVCNFYNYFGVPKIVEPVDAVTQIMAELVDKYGSGDLTSEIAKERVEAERSRENADSRLTLRNLDVTKPAIISYIPQDVSLN